MSTYKPKTIPFNHQAREFEEFGSVRTRALFWEQGCGKTKPTIDSAAMLFQQGKIDAIFVFAPNGVHRNWVSDELPTHLPDEIMAKTRCHVWYSSDTVRHRKSFEATLKHDGLAVVVMSYNAILTERARKAWKNFMTTRRCFYVLDESHYVKNPNAKWTKRILSSAQTGAEYRRILTGTPIANNPFDVYTQLRFLDPLVWRDFGISNFAAFKQFFGIWETRSTMNGRDFQHCVAFKNIDLLKERMERFGSRVTKEDALDLPPKLYSKRYFEISSKQQKLYQQLVEDYMIEFDSGEIIDASMAIVRLLRMHQVACGYLPREEGGVQDIEEKNPRLELLADTLGGCNHKAIIWARFRRDIELIRDHPFFRGRIVQVDGSVTGESRGKALDMFQKGDTQFLVANPAAISTGVTLHAARTVVYYSNSFSLTHRLQSEDRAHRIGQHHPVDYIDIVAAGTVDERIVEALRNKLDIASTITGDRLREWI